MSEICNAQPNQHKLINTKMNLEIYNGEIILLWPQRLVWTVHRPAFCGAKQRRVADSSWMGHQSKRRRKDYILIPGSLRCCKPLAVKTSAQCQLHKPEPEAWYIQYQLNYGGWFKGYKCSHLLNVKCKHGARVRCTKVSCYYAIYAPLYPCTPKKHPDSAHLCKVVVSSNTFCSILYFWLLDCLNGYKTHLNWDLVFVYNTTYY